MAGPPATTGQINTRVRLAREALFAWPRRCHYCRARATHVVPRCQDGADDFDNLVPACRRSNLQKGERTPEQWRTDHEPSGRPWPSPGAVWTRDGALTYPRTTPARDRSRAARRNRERWRRMQRSTREVQSAEWDLRVARTRSGDVPGSGVAGRRL